MTTTEAFEALMPRVAFCRVADVFGIGSAATWSGQTPDSFLYTAEQMRAMFDAATERAAKQCEQRADAYRSTNAPGWHNVVHECTQCVAAIRGTP